MMENRRFNSSIPSKSKKRLEQERLGTYKKPVHKGLKKTTIDALLGEGKIVRASSLKPKPRKGIRKRAKNNPGWWSYAMESVWPVVDHECEICGMPIEEPAPINFSHLLERGVYRKYIRDFRNIRISCGEHHRQWHEIPKEKLLDGSHGFKKEWERMFFMEEELKSEAHGLTPKPEME